MISLDNIRRVNTVSFIASGQVVQQNKDGVYMLQDRQSTIFPGAEIGFGAVKLFQAECVQGLTMQSQALTNAYGSTNMGFGKWLDALSNVLGYVPAFDYPRKFSYRGTEPLKFQLNCILRLKTDPIKDFVDPLRCLMGLYLPSRKRYTEDTYVSVWGSEERVLRQKGQAVSLSGWVDDKLKHARKSFNEFLAENEWINKIAGLLGIDSLSVGNLEDIVGKIYPLELPFPYDPKSVKGHLTMRLGRMRMPDVVITGVSLNIPVLLYEEGYPDHIKLTINVETLRIATTDMYLGLFDAISQDELGNPVLTDTEDFIDFSTMALETTKIINKKRYDPFPEEDD